MKVNGLNFKIYKWEIDNPKANVLLVHGLGEHAGRYEETARILNDIGFSVFAYDRRGEGATEGKRCYINNMEDQLSDLDVMKHTFLPDGQKKIILSHSLGGLISVRYMVDYKPDDIDALVLSSPLLESDDDMAPLLKKVARIVSALLPNLPVVKLDSSLITRDKNEVAKYDADPLIHHGGTPARTGYEILKSFKLLHQNFDKITTPFLLLHGSADKLANPRGSQLMYDNAASSDKTIKIFDGWYHEMMRELEKEIFFESISSWLLERF